MTYRRRNGFDDRERADGGGRAADGRPRGGRDPVHRGPGDLEPEGRHRGGAFGAGRGAGLRPGQRRRLRGARRRGHHRRGRHRSDGTSTRCRQAASHQASIAAERQHAAGPDELRRSCAWCSWAGGSRRTSAARRTSNGAWSVTTSTSSRAGRSPPCSPSPTTDDQDNHVYVSVGHQQMMTDAMKPLGLSLWQLTTPRPMHEAGGRLFVDVAPDLATPAGRASLLASGKVRPADPRRAADRSRPRRLRPLAPGRASDAAPPRRAAPAADRDRPGHRHRTDRAQPRRPSPPCGARSRPCPGRRCSTSSWPISQS